MIHLILKIKIKKLFYYNSFDTINYKEIINFGNKIEKKVKIKRLLLKKMKMLNSLMILN
jgi:hypothetical protein